MRRLLYGVLYFGVLGLLMTATVMVFIRHTWWAAVPAVLAIGWVSPLTQGIVDRMLGE